MKIKPLPGIIQLKIEEATAGALITASRESAVEVAEVIAVSQYDELMNVKVGDKVFVKAWAVDIITHDGQRYYFVDVNSKGILAVVK